MRKFELTVYRSISNINVQLNDSFKVSRIAYYTTPRDTHRGKHGREVYEPNSRGHSELGIPSGRESAEVQSKELVTLALRAAPSLTNDVKEEMDAPRLAEVDKRLTESSNLRLLP